MSGMGLLHFPLVQFEDNFLGRLQASHSVIHVLCCVLSHFLCRDLI
jgi:hypothetical protein